jgi:transposase
MTLSLTWIGIDISKAWLDVADPALALHQRVPNRPDALSAFATSLAGRNLIVVFEATGSYDAALCKALGDAGIGQARVNPRRARDFACATGRLAKTDRIDAAMLAAMGQALNLQAAQPPGEDLERLARLTRRRDQLVATRMQEKRRRAETADAPIADDLDRHIEWLGHAIAEVEAAMRSLLDASRALSATEAILRSMPGVGPVTAAVLVGLLPELGHRSGKQLVMLAGWPHSTTTAETGTASAPSPADGDASGRPSTWQRSPASQARPRSRPSTNVCAMQARHQRSLLSPLHESCSPHSTQWSEPKPRSEPEIQLPDSFRFASASGMTGR